MGQCEKFPNPCEHCHIGYWYSLMLTLLYSEEEVATELESPGPDFLEIRDPSEGKKHAAMRWRTNITL